MAHTEFFCHPGLSGASNMNSGSIDNGSPKYSSVSGNWDGTSVFTPTDNSNPSASNVLVGDFAHVFVNGASTPAYIARVTAVVNATNGTITLSTTAFAGTLPSVGTGTMSINVGGAWVGPSGSTQFPFNFNNLQALTDASGDYTRINFNNSNTYNMTAAITTANVGGFVYFHGYTSNPGDGGKATIAGPASGASFVLLTASGSSNNQFYRDLIFQNNGSTGTASLVTHSGGRAFWERCTFTGGVATGLNVGAGTLSGEALECEAYGNNTLNVASSAAFSILTPYTLRRCIAHDNAGTNTSGFRLQASCALVDCIADTNGGAGISIAGSTISVSIVGGAAYNNGTAATHAGIEVASALTSIVALLENVQLDSNSGFGINNQGGAGTLLRVSNCSFFNNTSGQTSGACEVSGSITLSASGMVDPANGNFVASAAPVKGQGRGNYTQNSGSYTKTTTAVPDVGVQSAGGSFNVGIRSGGRM